MYFITIIFITYNKIHGLFQEEDENKTTTKYKRKHVGCIQPNQIVIYMSWRVSFGLESSIFKFQRTVYQ